MKTLIGRIISKLLPVAFLCAGIAVNAQNTDLPDRDISLKVLNKRGRPVSKVVVHSLHTAHAGITDRTGLFVFREMSDKDTISVILPKYGEALIPVAGMDSIVISLRSSVRYSYEDNSGQSYVINKEKLTPGTTLDVQAMLKKRQYNSLADLLQGQVSGLFVSPAVSNPIAGDGVSTSNIRGVNSMNMSSEPLVVLDGVPLGTLNEANTRIDVNDIKTIDILKDGSGWGSRGANGVILIKSK